MDVYAGNLRTRAPHHHSGDGAQGLTTLVIGIGPRCGVDVVMVRGSQDSALSSRLGEEETARLAGAGIDFTTVTYGGGHDIDAETLSSFASTRRAT